jgi:glyoxylase-like metal-dependent hydrolase (beta-lactamase superfamily II)
MTEIVPPNLPLTWDVFVARGIPTVSSDLPPGATQRVFSPVSATLIQGNREAVLVDTLLTVAQATALADWVEAHGKDVRAIYATHGHGDHFFGAATLLERFSSARFVATADVITVMQKQAAPEVLEMFWKTRFPGQIADRIVIADELKGNSFELEGQELVAVPLGHTDTEKTTCLHVPSIGLVVAGDAAYNGVHQHLGECDANARREWIAALDTIEALKPRAVIAGHKRAGTDDSPRIIEETRQYIRDFGRIAATSSTALNLYQQMRALYPDRENPSALWSSARSIKG